MAIDSTKLLVAVKAYARGNALPLDASEVQDSLEAAQAYAKSATAYAGQTVKALVNGKYETYVLNGKAGAYTLDKVGVDASAVKNYVQVLDNLPSTGDAEQGVIYIVGKKGFIFDSSTFRTVFEDVTTSEGKSLADQLGDINTKFAQYAPLAGATFTGEVVLAADPTKNLGAVTKQYVDRLIANLQSSAPGVVDADNPLPATGYKAGASWRVAAVGTYAGQACEVGDLIIAVSDADDSNDDNFIVVQANIDGAVTGPAASTDANIVVFDGVTGKKIADSTVNIASVKDAVSKAHTHANKDILDSYNKNQTDLLAAAAEDAASKVKVVSNALASKADTTKVYTKEETDNFLKPIKDNLNTKLDGADVDAKIAAKVGDIADGTTVKAYVDAAVAGGSGDVATQIAEAKTDAIKQSNTYTDTIIASALTIIEFT